MVHLVGGEHITLLSDMNFRSTVNIPVVFVVCGGFGCCAEYDIFLIVLGVALPAIPKLWVQLEASCKLVLMCTIRTVDSGAVLVFVSYLILPPTAATSPFLFSEVPYSQGF